MNIPRAEHPKPQFERANWLNLNGVWQFEIDQGCSGIPRGLARPDAVFSKEITVPFCPESRLSGLAHTDFLRGVWYKRTITLTEAQCTGRVVLHFGAVDYHCHAFVNGQPVGEHKGGYVSFSFDITEQVSAGENIITVYAKDDTRNPLIPAGKQSSQYDSCGCVYTRTTGIWQTVWLEFTPKSYIKNTKYYPDYEKGELTVFAELCGTGDFLAETSFEGRPTGSFAAKDASGLLQFTIALSEIQLWEVGHGRLYDLNFTFGEDRVKSYFGLRNVRMDDYRFLLNGKSVFQRLVLDQGFYLEGIYTAPTDTDLKRDIEMSIAMGFNGARPHEKIFEERYFYHCDKLGYLVWGEYPDWGLDPGNPQSIYSILPEWLEEVARDFNHPSIIGWCPRNETNGSYPPCISLVYDVTKSIDPTRPCIDASGWNHVKSDIYCVHNYTQDPVQFKEHYATLCEGEIFETPQRPQKYWGGPIFVSEYGGIRWTDKEGWGYGEGPKTEEEFIERFRGLTDVLLDHPQMFGLCYTQLTDVEQEQNGLYTYERVAKFDPTIIRPILSRKAKIEE